MKLFNKKLNNLSLRASRRGNLFLSSLRGLPRLSLRGTKQSQMGLPRLFLWSMARNDKQGRLPRRGGSQ